MTPEAKKKAAEAKSRGDDAFKRKDYHMAIDSYTQVTNCFFSPLTNWIFLCFDYWKNSFFSCNEMTFILFALLLDSSFDIWENLHNCGAANKVECIFRETSQPPCLTNMTFKFVNVILPTESSC